MFKHLQDFWPSCIKSLKFSTRYLYPIVDYQKQANILCYIFDPYSVLTQILHLETEISLYILLASLKYCIYKSKIKIILWNITKYFLLNWMNPVTSPCIQLKRINHNDILLIYCNNALYYHYMPNEKMPLSSTYITALLLLHSSYHKRS